MSSVMGKMGRQERRLRSDEGGVFPLVSVVITCFNYGEFLYDALNSVLSQTFQDIEVIVVEGGSTQSDTRSLVRELSNRAPDNVRFLLREEPHLPGDNRNAGIALARGCYIVCLDADDVLLPTYIEVALFVAEKYGFDVVYPSVRDFGCSSDTWWVEEATFDGMQLRNMIPTTALFRRRAWELVGGYRDFGFGKEHVPEDYEFWFRVLGRGFKAQHIREIMHFHRRHDKNLTKENRSATSVQIGKIKMTNAKLLTHTRRHVEDGSVSRHYTWNAMLSNADNHHQNRSIVFVHDADLSLNSQKFYSQLVELLRIAGWVVSVVAVGGDREHVYERPQPLRATAPRYYYLPLLFENCEQGAEFCRYLMVSVGVRNVWLIESEKVEAFWSQISTFVDTSSVLMTKADATGITCSKSGTTYNVSFLMDHLDPDKRAQECCDLLISQCPET